jgi:hypothetical protein
MRSWGSESLIASSALVDMVRSRERRKTRRRGEQKERERCAGGTCTASSFDLDDKVALCL